MKNAGSTVARSATGRSSAASAVPSVRRGTRPRQRPSNPSLSANLLLGFQTLSDWRIPLSGKSSGESPCLGLWARREFKLERYDDAPGNILIAACIHSAAQRAIRIEHSANRIDVGFASATRPGSVEAKHRRNAVTVLPRNPQGAAADHQIRAPRGMACGVRSTVPDILQSASCPLPARTSSSRSANWRFRTPMARGHKTICRSSHVLVESLSTPATRAFVTPSVPRAAS